VVPEATTRARARLALSVHQDRTAPRPQTATHLPSRLRCSQAALLIPRAAPSRHGGRDGARHSDRLREHHSDRLREHHSDRLRKHHSDRAIRPLFSLLEPLSEFRWPQEV